jgi:peptidoglycan lytic transglycosylase
VGDTLNRVLCAAIAVFSVAVRMLASASAESGIASVYSGDRTQTGGMTAAHRSLPLGTRVRVTNRKNGRSVVVDINDRGPFVRGRVIDLSPAAARDLDFSGTAPIILDRVGD